MVAPTSDAALAPSVPPRPGLFGQLLLPFFRTIDVGDEACGILEEAHAAGTVVFTLRAKRLVDPLFILYALERLQLPIPEWLHDHPASRRPTDAASLVETVRHQQSALLFLRRPRTLTSRSVYSEPHVAALLALQAQSERPILLVPTALQWRTRPVGLRRSLIDAVYGDLEDPAATREMLGFFWQHREARFHVGAPVDLRTALARDPGASEQRMAKKVRWLILHHLAREEEIRTGPVHRSAARTRQAVLNDPRVKKFVASQVELGKPREAIEHRMQGVLRKIAADMRSRWLRVFDAAIDLIWRRIYDGIQVDEEGLAKVKRAARRGPVVVVPSHKSHADYLVLSQVFYRNNLVPPHIAAGENLDFWPLGHIFRRGGAFFIRRAFRGDKLYTAVFSAYVRRLLKEGHALEFFIEGGRSRTGRLLAPKLGMLSMCVEPAFDGSIPDVSFIPISIGYERILEGEAFARELAGESKVKENVRSLVRSAGVLKSRYGRVYVDFDEPMSLRTFARQRGLQLPLPEEDHRNRRAIIKQLAHRIIYGIHAVTRASPSSVVAMALLTAPMADACSEAELVGRAQRLVEQLAWLGARCSPTLADASSSPSVREALERFVRDRAVDFVMEGGQKRYRPAKRKRILLDYYKNNLLHFFLPGSVAALAYLATEADLNRSRGRAASGTAPPLPEERSPVPLGAMRTWAERISQLLRKEFSFRGGSDTFEPSALEALLFLESQGALLLNRPTEEIARGSEDHQLAELASLLAPSLSAYRLLGEVFREEETKTAVLTEKYLLDKTLLVSRQEDFSYPEAAAPPVLRQALSLHLAEDAIRRGSKGVLLAGDADAQSKLQQDLESLLALFSHPR